MPILYTIVDALFKLLLSYGGRLEPHDDWIDACSWIVDSQKFPSTDFKGIFIPLLRWRLGDINIT
jgi:hypothetical protein